MESSNYNTNNLEEEEGNTIYFTIKDANPFEDVISKFGLNPKTFKKEMKVLKIVLGKLLVMASFFTESGEIESPYIFSFHDQDGKTTIRLYAFYTPVKLPKSNKNEAISNT